MARKTTYSADRPVHVLEVVGNSIVGGVEKYVENLARHLPARGFKVSVVVPFESAFTAELRRLDSQVFVTEMDMNPPWRSIQFVVELVRFLDVDVLHAHLPRAHVLAGLAGNLTGIPAAATVHGMEIETPELGIARTTGTHIILVCQQAYANALALGMPAERLALIPNGVDLEHFHPEQEPGDLRERLRIPEQAALIGFVGRLSPEKGPDQFVRLARRVLDAEPEARFVMAGGGPMEAEIRAMVEENQLHDRLFLLGSVKDPATVYSNLDMLVQTSHIEGMPFVLLEAMGAGLPVLAMNVGGVGELIESGTTGLLSAAGDWAGLADAVTGLLRKPQEIHRMGDAGRRRAEERFDLQASVDQIAAFLRRQAHSSHQPAKDLHPFPALDEAARRSHL